MKDRDVTKEGLKENFDYSDFWDEEEEEDVEKKVSSFSKGEPRQGLRGKYLKKKGNVSVRQMKRSYGKYFKSVSE